MVDPKSPPRLILLRHGRSEANASGLLQGRMDPPLDDFGAAQADRAARMLSDAALGEIRTVITSPLLRARQTASRLGLPIEVDERFIEVDYGEYDGMPLADVPSDTWTRWRDDASFTPPGGESLVEVGLRVRAACEELQRRAREEGTILVVSHVSPIKAAVLWALGMDDGQVWRTHLDTASVSMIDVDRGQPVLRGFNIAPVY